MENKKTCRIELLRIHDILGNKRELPYKDFIVSDSKTNKIALPLEKPFIMDGLGIIFCSNGKVVLNLNSRKIETGTNSIHIIFPHHITEILEVSDNLDFSFIFFLLIIFSILPFLLI